VDQTAGTLPSVHHALVRLERSFTVTDRDKVPELLSLGLLSGRQQVGEHIGVLDGFDFLDFLLLKVNVVEHVLLFFRVVFFVSGCFLVIWRLWWLLLLILVHVSFLLQELFFGLLFFPFGLVFELKL
jgi:hypothetical protein